jgi:hypothetical protein
LKAVNLIYSRPEKGTFLLLERLARDQDIHPCNEEAADWCNVKLLA